MKNILFIPVGGTICTRLNLDGALSVYNGAGAFIIDNFMNSDSAYRDDVKFTLADNLMILSENMNVEKWNHILDSYRFHKGKYDGVIFAHGTDTLAFSASLFSMIPTDIPVFFVSSNARLDSDRANGNDNFRCAVECICNNITPNVYVPYRNISDGKMLLHLGSRIMQCRNYSEDFESIGAVEIVDRDYDGALRFFEKFPSKASYPEVSMNNIRLKDKVIALFPYVGLNYDAIDFSRFSAVLHGTYHSGTVCSDSSDNSVFRLLDICKDNVDVYLSPSRAEGEIYESLKFIVERGGVEFLYGCTFETAYAKLIIAYSVFEDKDKIKTYMKTEQNYEFFA